MWLKRVVRTMILSVELSICVICVACSSQLNCFILHFLTPEPRVYSLQEIALLQKALKKTQSEAGLMKFVIIDNKVYDITDFIADHPGGENVISTHIGKDATGAYSLI